MAIAATAGSSGAAVAEAVAGRDLTDRARKIVFFAGRGKTGKTTALRWMAEQIIEAGTPVLMADLDPTNGTFSHYVEGVARPDGAGNPAIALKWLERFLQQAAARETSAIIDLGGGDTTLRQLAAQAPDLVPMLEAQGFAVVVFYTVGPQEEDLTPLATMQALGFRPTASAIVLNEALADFGETREQSFDRILRHSLVREALAHGTVPVWMPRLLPASEVEVRRLHFRDAMEGGTGTATTPLGLFDRARVRLWLGAMTQAFAGVQSWLP